MCKVYAEYHGTSEIKHGLCARTVDNPLAKARGLSLRTGAKTMLYLSLIYSVQTLTILEVHVSYKNECLQHVIEYNAFPACAQSQKGAKLETR